MKLYIAGPMTYQPQFNFPAFMNAADALRADGFEVVSPAELDDPETREQSMASATGDPADLPDQTWGDALARDVKLIADEVDGTALLPGWQESRGARLEAFITRLLGKPVFYNLRCTCGSARDPEHRRVCNCDLIEGELLDNYLPPLLELDDPELDAVLTVGDLDVLRKIERDENMNARGTGTEIRITSDTGGQKGRKPERLDLVPGDPLMELSRVYGFGATKYDDHNYLKGYDWSLSIGAMQRHLQQWIGGEDLDEESGCNHLAHVAWHCFTLQMYQQHALGTDDRLFHVLEDE